MTHQEATNFTASTVSVSREDVARAKNWLIAIGRGDTGPLADQWIAEQQLATPKEVDLDSADCQDILKSIARVLSVQLAFFQAVWELVAAGEIISIGGTNKWDPPLNYRTRGTAAWFRTLPINCHYPTNIERPPYPSPIVNDPDVFLQRIDCKILHPGILEAIDQALGCFRRALYMPATAMLAAAAEATWTECGIRVAKHISSKKLDRIINDPYAGFALKVTETRQALEQGTAKALLKKAGTQIAKVIDAELWTTTLRDRRNALHWTKAKSFIASHSDTSTLLMAAPMHIGTLEAIRAVC